MLSCLFRRKKKDEDANADGRNSNAGSGRSKLSHTGNHRGSARFAPQHSKLPEEDPRHDDNDEDHAWRGTTLWEEQRREWLTPTPEGRSAKEAAGARRGSKGIPAEKLFECLNYAPYPPLPHPVRLQYMVAVLDSHGMLVMT